MRMIKISENVVFIQLLLPENERESMVLKLENTVKGERNQTK